MMGSKILQDYYHQVCPVDGSSLEDRWIHAPPEAVGKRYSCPSCRKIYDEGESTKILDEAKVHERLIELNLERSLLQDALSVSQRN